MKVSGLDYRISWPHQKRPHGSPPWTLPMRSESTHGSSRVRLSRTRPHVGSFLVLGAVAFLLALSAVRAEPAGYGPEEYEWTNGSVLCVFNDSVPSVTVSAFDLNASGMVGGLAAVEEVSPTTEATVSVASMSSLSWEPENASSAAAYAMSYSEEVPVFTVGPSPTAAGVAGVSVTFTLDRTASSAAPSDQVSFQVSIEDWPWQSTQDTLALVVPMWSADAATEHLVVPSSSTARIESVSSSTGQMREYFEAGSTAETSTGTSVPVGVSSVETDGVATATLTLGSPAGGATGLTYSATFGIAPTTRVLGIPLYDYAAVAGGAGLVALVVGVGTGRIRRAPSDLTYVEESE